MIETGPGASHVLLTIKDGERILFLAGIFSISINDQ